MKPHRRTSLRSSTPNSHLLATASVGATGLWEVASGQRLAILRHEDRVSAVTFSPDGHLLATASGDKTARLWLWQPADLVAEARARLSRNLTVEEWQQYLGDEPYRNTIPNLPRRRKSNKSKILGDEPYLP